MTTGDYTKTGEIDRNLQLESLHRDLVFANQFRLEGIKSALLISTALIAFTVSFRPMLRDVKESWMMLVAWLALAASISGSLANLFWWEKFYASYRKDWQGKPNEGKSIRSRILRFRSWALGLQMLGLPFGVILIAIFTWINFTNVVARGTP